MSKGSNSNAEVLGVIPYMDPKMLIQGTSYKINKKSDIYILGVLFWELTSCSSPFNYETRNDHTSLMLDILSGLRENPVPNTNTKFVELYQKCWEFEPDKRPDFYNVIAALDGIDSAPTISYSEESKYIMISSDNKIPQIIKRFKPQEFEFHPGTIGSGRFALVTTAKWMGTSTTYAIKRFRNSSMNNIINEIYLMGMGICHPNIIKICGVTTLEDTYSLVLEYVDSGTLGEYLRKEDVILEWKHKSKFANDMANFGCSRLHGSVIDEEEKPYGVMSYVDPKILLSGQLCDLTKKSDIYSLAILFWQLTSRKPPFESETNPGLNIRIINGKRETPIPNTNDEYVKLYQRCWEFDPDDRPDISEIVSILNNIGSEKNIIIISSETSVITKELENDNMSCQIRNN